MIRFIFRNYGMMLFLALVLGISSASLGILVLSQITSELDFVAESKLSINKLPMLIAMVLVMILSAISSQYILAKITAKTIADIRLNIVKRILKTEFHKIEELGGHKIYASLTADITRINKGIYTVPEYVYSLASVLLALLYIGYLSIGMLALTVIMISLAILIVKLLLKRAIYTLTKLRQNDDDLFEKYQTLVEGNKELNINYFRKRYFYNKLFLPIVLRASDNTIKSHVDFSIISNVGNAFVFITMICLLYGANFLLPDVSTNELVSTMLVFIYMVGPLSFIIDSFKTLADASIGYKNIQSFEMHLGEIAQTRGENKIIEESIKVEVFSDNWKAITLNNITFQYPLQSADASFSIGPINLRLNRGEVVFISGGNGSGKTTLGKLLCGLYRPTAGEILVGDTVINDMSEILAYRKLFTTVFTDFYLFKDVLNEYGAPAKKEEVSEILKDLKMNKKVDVINGKLTTTKLSEGQRKRLALMQSRLENAPIFLFDEWAAYQDPFFRNYFYCTILNYLKGINKLIVVISHDDQYFGYCDRLFKLENGKLQHCLKTEKSVLV